MPSPFCLEISPPYSITERELVSKGQRRVTLKSLSPLSWASGIIREDPSKAPNASYKDEVCSYKRRRQMARQAKDEEREERRHEMFVLNRWRPHELAVPLMQVRS